VLWVPTPELQFTDLFLFQQSAHLPRVDLLKLCAGLLVKLPVPWPSVCAFTTQWTQSSVSTSHFGLVAEEARTSAPV
jgi:hypothetical protein